MASVRRRAAWVALALLMAPAAGGAAPPAAAAPPSGHARGFGVMIDGATVAAARADADGRPHRRVLARDVAGTGGSVAVVEVRVGAGARGGTGVGEAVALARGVSLAGGRVVVDHLRLAVQAHVGADGARVGLADYGATGLLVDGRPVEATPGMRVDLAGLGTLTLFEQVTDAAGSVRANALRLEVTDAASGLPVGTEVAVGHLEAEAAAGDPAVPLPPPTPAPRRAVPETAPQPEPSLPAPALPRVPVRPLPPPVRTPELPSPAPLLPRRVPPAGLLPPQTAGYVFPVHGPSSYSDDYGAPRAVTGWHHGIDIFAPEGAPVLAVADGTLFKVGVNTLGGNRLWLRDDRGNTFYYAHLSAYAPGVLDGARVRAGEVIGFVGQTGQAMGTPPHLHFEIHPGDGDSVNPYPYLLAWERRTDVPLAFQAAESADGQAPAPAAGALVIGFTPLTEVIAPAGDGLARVAP
jgi:murein DD-endopeptidase MepM/ murein hydrolase activator NlpD